ncbi:MAG TPA: hypothetical protein VEC11_07125 [Allosphingosinicella sp.]|nr:hypothetical protein [Allosphingosinicella sp.]
MVRKIVSATVSAALCMMSVAPAMAQEHRFTGFDAPRGASIALNLRIPLGNAQQSRERMSYGLTLGYGQSVGSPTLDGTTITRRVNFADIRLNREGALRTARFAGFDLANLDRSRAMNLVGGGKKTWLLIGGIIVAGVVICLAADCFDGDDDSPSDS